MAKETVPVVPPRNDLKKVEVYAVSRATQLSGRDPNFEYQWMSTDPANPCYHERYLKEQEIGDPEAGYVLTKPWEYVSSKDHSTGRPRDDQGAPVDTAMRHGSLVLMRTPKENYAAYVEIDKRKDAAKAKRMTADTSKIPGAKHVHRFGYGFDGTHEELLSSKENS